MYKKQLTLALWDAKRDWLKYLAWGHVKIINQIIFRDKIRKM